MADVNVTERSAAMTGSMNGSNPQGSAASQSAQPERDGVTTWPHLAEGLYSFLTGRGAVIEYTFENMEVLVPRDTAPNSPSARWKMNGTIRIRTYEATPGGAARP